jgi:hypothetical protein
MEREQPHSRAPLPAEPIGSSATDLRHSATPVAPPISGRALPPPLPRVEFIALEAIAEGAAEPSAPGFGGAESGTQLPRYDAQYAPPREAPRETDHRTLHMRRVVIAEQADPRRQSTRMIRRGWAAAGDGLKADKVNTHQPRVSKLNAEAARSSDWAVTLQRMPVATLLGAVALGAFLGAGAWLYFMGATRALQLTTESRQATRALLQADQRPPAEPVVAAPAHDPGPGAHSPAVPQERPDIAATPPTAALGAAPIPTVSVSALLRSSPPVVVPRSPRAPVAEPVKNAPRRKGATPASSAPRGQTQRSWLENDEPAAWIR